jgi:Cupredoxin-like domain
LYQWWVFVHLAGVFGLLVSHGVSVAVTFRLRAERDPARAVALLEISGSTITAFYVSLAVLLLGGIVGAFEGGLWGYGWIWASLGTLAAVIGAMYVLARPYYHRIRFVATALAEGSRAVTPEQFERLLKAPRSLSVAAIGFAGLAVILFLMLFKPTLGMAPAAPGRTTAGGPEVALEASELAFGVRGLAAPADERFALRFANDSSVAHNVSIYRRNGEPLFTGEVITGPRIVEYMIPPLAAGRYQFVCDVHPQQMSGTLVAR